MEKLEVAVKKEFMYGKLDAEEENEEVNESP